MAHPTIVTVALIVVNLAFKSVGLDQSIWLDEAITLFLAQHPLDIVSAAANDATPPLYHLLASGWIRVAGISEPAIRSLSVVSSSMTAGFLFLFGRRFLSARAGLIAALLFTASNIHLHYAQEARCYAFLSLLSLVSFYLFLSLLERPSLHLWIALCLTNAALMFTHYLALFALVAQLSTACLFVRSHFQAFRAYLLSLAGSATLFSPWALFLYFHWPPITPAWLAPPTPGSVESLFQLYAGNRIPVAIWAAIMAALLARILWLAAAGRMTLPWEGLILVILWAALPVGSAYLLSAITPMFLHRYLLYSSLGLFLLFAYLISEVDLPAFARLGVVILAVAASLLELRNDPVPRQDWKEAVRLARNEFRGDAILVVAPWYEWYPFAYYFDPDAFRDFSRTVPRLEAEGVYLPRSLGPVIPPITAEASRIITLTNPEVAVDEHAFSRRGFLVANKIGVRGVTLMIFERATP